MKISVGMEGDNLLYQGASRVLFLLVGDKHEKMPTLAKFPSLPLPPPAAILTGGVGWVYRLHRPGSRVVGSRSGSRSGSGSGSSRLHTASVSVHTASVSHALPERTILVDGCAPE